MNGLYNTHNHKRKWKYNSLYNNGSRNFYNRLNEFLSQADQNFSYATQ